MRKLLLIVLSFCFLLGWATKAEVENEVIRSDVNLEKREYEPLIKPEEEPNLYKTEVNQVAPQSGIETGHFIAYGHYIKPPYKLQIKNDTMLFINGVQIVPCVTSAFEIEKERREEERFKEEHKKADSIAKPYEERIYSFFDEMRRVYKEVERKGGRDKAIDSIYKLAEAETLIVEMGTVNLVGEDDCSFRVIYFMPGYDTRPDDLSYLPIALYGSDSSSGYSPIRDINKVKKHVNHFKATAEKDLKNNTVIFFSSFKTISYRREYAVWPVKRILEADTITIEEKAKKLDEFLPGEKESKELIHNFDPSEWPEKKEVGKE